MTASQPSSGSAQACATCGTRHRADPGGPCPRAARHQRVKEAGLCRCGQPVRPGTTRCDPCHAEGKAAQAQRAAELLDAGLCRCLKPLDGPGVLCEACARALAAKRWTGAGARKVCRVCMEPGHFAKTCRGVAVLPSFEGAKPETAEAGA